MRIIHHLHHRIGIHNSLEHLIPSTLSLHIIGIHKGKEGRIGVGLMRVVIMDRIMDGRRLMAVRQARPSGRAG
jgi:hypothetical protein